MTSPTALPNVAARVGEIRTRLVEMRGVPGPASDAIGEVPDTAGFDPFGEAYQQALLASGAGGGGGATQRTDPTGIGGAPSGAVLVRPRVASFAGSSLAVPGAVGAAAGGTITVRHNGQVGGYGEITVPPELAAYGDGRVPAAALEPIGQGSHRLWAPAAESWKQAVAAARADGIDLRITDSYRSYDEQVDLAGRKGLYANGGLAAVPGTSNHGWGMAVDADVTNPTTMQWMRDNAHRFGFVQPMEREPWHWEYRPAQA